MEAKNEGMVTFGDNGEEKIIDIDNIGITPSTYIENILLIDSLKHNLLSISQLCDKGYKVIFESSMCIVTSPTDVSTKFMDIGMAMYTWLIWMIYPYEKCNILWP